MIQSCLNRRQLGFFEMGSSVSPAELAASSTVKSIVAATVEESLPEWRVDPVYVCTEPGASTLLCGSTSGTAENLVSKSFDSGNVLRATLEKLPFDDHNAPAIWKRAARWSVACWSNHGLDNHLRPGTFGPVTKVSALAP